MTHLNHRWSQGVAPNLPPQAPTSFEKEAERLGLTQPIEWEHSVRLRAWVEKHRWKRFVPEELLRTWGLELYDQDVSLAKGT